MRTSRHAFNTPLSYHVTTHDITTPCKRCPPSLITSPSPSPPPSPQPPRHMALGERGAQIHILTRHGAHLNGLCGSCFSSYAACDSNASTPSLHLVSTSSTCLPSADVVDRYSSQPPFVHVSLCEMGLPGAARKTSGKRSQLRVLSSHRSMDECVDRSSKDEFDFRGRWFTGMS